MVTAISKTAATSGEIPLGKAFFRKVNTLTIFNLNSVNKYLVGISLLSFNLQNKGQSEFYQYLIGILFGMLIVISISLLFYSLHNSFVESNLRDSLTPLAIQTSDNIVKLSD